MTIICNRCQLEGPDELFALSASTGKRTKVCQGCYDKHYAHLAKSPEHHKSKAKAADRAARKKNIERGREVLFACLNGKSCMDCGYDNFIALELDHRDPTIKCDAVTRLVNDGVAVDRILTEIKKCDIVCANCHAIRTAIRCNSWRVQKVS